MSTGTDIDAVPFADALRKMAERFEREVTVAIDRTEFWAMTSLEGTRRFEDRTGNLRASFSSAPRGIDERVVSAGMPYAGFLEWGTRTITPRPFMNDAREMIVGMLPIEMGEAWTRAVTGHG